MRAAEYATMFRVEETHWWYQALHALIFQELAAELPDWREKKILDAGCGTGAILQRLGNPEKNVGIDLAPEAIEFCRQRGLTNVLRGDVNVLPFEDASFDVIISSSVIYHDWVPDVARAIGEMRRVLRPGGVLIANVPAFRFLHSAHDDAVMTARRFRKPEIRAFLMEHGFEIRRLTYWTTFLFPLAIAVRTLGGSKMGRDFESTDSRSQRLLAQVMKVERRLLRNVSLPIGVALFVVARRPPS